MAVMEAMACRRPVVLSDIAPHREIVKDVDFIPLINPDDVTGFASTIKRYREMTALERTVLGEKCRKLIEEQFSLPVMHAGYAAIYSEITGHHIMISKAQRSDLNQKYVA